MSHDDDGRRIDDPELSDTLAVECDPCGRLLVLCGCDDDDRDDDPREIGGESGYE